MQLIRSTVVVILATAWLTMLSAKDVIVGITVGMRTMLGEDGEPISIFMFFMLVMAAVFLTGLTGTLIALLKNY